MERLNNGSEFIPDCTASNEQYRLRRIIGLWATATLPPLTLTWGVIPVLIPYIDLPPAMLYWLALVISMAWQFGVSLRVIRHEESNPSWTTLRRRLWLNKPHARLFLWLLPCLFVTFISLVAGVFLVPFFASFVTLPSFANVMELASPEFAGQWWLVGAVLIVWVGNTFLAEELLLRGVLLPKMNGAFGRWDWAANAVLSGLYYLHKPWMIPFRLVDSLVIAWLAKRCHSNWISIILRGVEVVGLLVILLVGVTALRLEPLPTSMTFPTISQRPSPARWHRQVPIQSLSLPNSDSNETKEIDLRSCDLSALDLHDSLPTLFNADFDSQTVWPSDDRMPSDFDLEQILELGKNPGLGVRELHAQGITGRGVSLAIIDMPLLTEHQEYADQLRWYEDVSSRAATSAAMHGPAVASIAVGEAVGVAPEADLYYISFGDNWRSLLVSRHYIARGIRRILQINGQLPEDRKIRVVSISAGWTSGLLGYYDVTAAIREAEAKGILVVYVGAGPELMGLGRFPLADPDAFDSYVPGLFWSGYFRADQRYLLVPMDSRTTASPTGVDEYAFHRFNGMSWAVPYAAGVYALTAQVDPSITPERFWSLAVETGRTIEFERDGQVLPLGRIIDPAALIDALQ